MTDERRFAKLINKVLTFAPKNKGSIVNYYLDEDAMIADGYKLFVPAVLDPSKTYTNFRYKETATQIKELCDEVPEPTPEEMIEIRREQFHKEFFHTSLGYIRRIVTKADGTTADFLLDYVALINKAVEENIPYPIITYIEPDFTEDVVDWTQYQVRKIANAQFILECLTQAGNDFKPATPESSVEQGEEE